MKNAITTITTPAGSFTLKGIKVVRWMSQETLCFTASVIFNGKNVGEVSNEGSGGCTFIHFNSPALREEVEAFANTIDHNAIGLGSLKAYPDVKAVSAADLCDYILEEKEKHDHKTKMLTKIKKDALKYVLYLKADCGSGQYYSHKKNLAKGFTIERVTADVKAKGYTLVSEMSDEAIITHFGI